MKTIGQDLFQTNAYRYLGLMTVSSKCLLWSISLSSAPQESPQVSISDCLQLHFCIVPSPPFKDKGVFFLLQVCWQFHPSPGFLKFTKVHPNHQLVPSKPEDLKSFIGWRCFLTMFPSISGFNASPSSCSSYFPGRKHGFLIEKHRANLDQLRIKSD